MKSLRHLSFISLICFAFSNQAIAECALTPEQILRDDVLIVVNDNSISSKGTEDTVPVKGVGDYYCEKRGINPANVAHVHVPVTNDIQLDQFISLRDQIIKHLQDITFPPGNAVTCDTTKGYTRYYCPESIDQLRQNSKVRYLVMTKGLPIRFAYTNSELTGGLSNAEASVDNYLRFWLTNYFPTDIKFGINNRAIAFGDGRGMRKINPEIDQELIVGRIDGVDTESAKRLVDRAINAEINGIYGKLYGNKFGGNAEAAGSEGAYWKSWLPNGQVEVVYPSPNYLHGLFGELQGLAGPAVRHTTNPECLNATGVIPKECVTAINPGGIRDGSIIGDLPPGSPDGKIPSPDNALVHQGYIDTFSSLGAFEHLLNWRDSDSDSCNTFNTLCADDEACKNASTDAYKEIDTRCVRVAEGYMGYNFSSYPVGMMASWPTGWFQSVNFHPEKFNLTGSDHYYYWQPEVLNDDGFDDKFSLWYRNSDENPAAACYSEQENSNLEEYQALPDGHCNIEKKISINQTIDIPERSINLADPQEITIQFKYRGIGLDRNVPITLGLLIRESEYEDNEITIGKTNQVLHGFAAGPTLAFPNDPVNVNEWKDAAITFTLDPDLHQHPQRLYDGIRIFITAATAFEGELAFDNFSVKEDGIELPLVNPSFDDGHRQLSGGDSAATFLSRMNGTAFWGNVSHHADLGHSFDAHPYETLIYFMRGLPLGDAVWFAEIRNSGILYGDPLYSPVAIHLHYLSPRDSWAPNDHFSIEHDSPLKLTGGTLNGSGANVTTTYSVDYCSGNDFLTCDQNGNWNPIIGMQDLEGGQRDMSLGDWDISSIPAGSYVLRLSITSNFTNGLKQTFYDYYPITLYIPIEDEDGLSYQEELAAGTNPRNEDTDEDGLPDDWELARGFDPLVSNANTDSDGDGFFDFIELLRGSDPTDSTSIPIFSTFEVDPVNGIDDGNDGTTPFKTLESALSAAQAGDTISLFPGKYDIDVIDFTVPIHLQGPPDQSAIFQSIFLLWNRTIGPTIISNLTFRTTDLTIGGDISNNRWQFRKNNFSINTNIINNTIVEFTSNLFTAASENALNITNGSSATLINNTITGNNVGVKADAGSDVQIINSIISKNFSADLIGVLTGSVSYSLTGDRLLAGSNGNIFGDPLFVDPLKGDYHLMPKSPAIDAGDPLYDFSQEPTSTIGRINLGVYGNTDEAQTAASQSSGGSTQQASQSSGQIDWLLLFLFSFYGAWRYQAARNAALKGSFI